MKEGMPEEAGRWLMQQIQKENGKDDGPKSAGELIDGMKHLIRKWMEEHGSGDHEEA